MKDRERFLNYMTFQPVDRAPVMEMGFWTKILERWHHEGSPKWVTHDRHAEAYLGLDLGFNRNWLPINDMVYPPFEVETLEENETVQVIRDENGVILRQQKRI